MENYRIIEEEKREREMERGGIETKASRNAWMEVQIIICRSLIEIMRLAISFFIA